MKIGSLDIKLPLQEEFVKRFFANCENRRKFVEDAEEHYKQHLKKAKHDLERALAEFRDGCWDWTIIKSYYAVHHAGNALLSKNKSLFSKDHSCLIIALKYYDLIDQSLFEKLVKINERFSNVFSLDLTFQLRKISQYSVDEWEDLTKEDDEVILEIAKQFIKYVEERI